MKYQEFIETVKNYITLHVSHMYKVIVQPIQKNNGIIYDGLVIIDPVLNISPTIYLNPYYHRYLSGVAIEDILEDILKTYHNNLPKQNFDTSLFCDFAKAKERIMMRLINYAKNEDLLFEIPHIQFHDLAIIFVCSVSDCLQEYATILIHNSHLFLWGITDKELYTLAMKNTPQLLPYTFEHMRAYFQRMMHQSLPFFDGPDIYLLSNSVKIHGSSCIVYPGLLAKISNQLHDNLIIIPSSIHEVLILPESATKNLYTFADFKEMITDANETHLTDDEILSDHAYFYSQSTNELISEL